MKRLYDDENLVKKVKRLNFLASLEWYSVIGVLGLEIAVIIGKVAKIITANWIDYFTIGNAVLIFNGIGSRNIANRNEKFLETLEDDIKEITNEECKIASLDDIEIIPKEIQIGEDLSSKNIVPITKEGYYMVIHARPSKICLRQYKNDDKQYLVDILEDDEISEIDESVKIDTQDKRKRLVLK